MKSLSFSLPLVLLALLPHFAQAQIKQDAPDTGSLQLGEPVVTRFRVGAEITARKGACQKVRAMVAIPFECAEQEVRKIDEEVTPDVEMLEFRSVPGGDATQMLITIPYLANGATAKAVITYEVKTRPVQPTEETAGLTIPARVDNDMRRYILPSPFIEAKHSEIRRQSREILKDVDKDATDWEKLEAVYDFVQDNIEYLEGAEDRSAVDVLRDGRADCHGRSALFIALCRAIKTPARVVWVNEHCYSEFYLEDSAGKGTWFPAESAGTRAFGEMPLARVIMQKGDNFRVPERPGERLRYATDYLLALPVGNAGKPKVTYIREPVQ